MREVLEELNEWTSSGEEIALATVVETWGSSPRPLGSKMLVTRSGKMAGSVSNGCIEGAVFEEAQKVLKSGDPKLAAFGVSDDVAFEVGLACGGHIEVYVQPLQGVHKQLIEMLNRNEPATLRTNMASGETELIQGAASSTELAKRDGDLFVEPFRRPAHLVIIGAIHIAIPLHRLAKLMGYRVTVIDARAKFATKERFPEAEMMTQLGDFKFVAIEGNTILVRGLDCLDDTPLLDIKPDRCEFTPLAPPQAGDFETE